jgi:hypothetical protein
MQGHLLCKGTRTCVGVIVLVGFVNRSTTPLTFIPTPYAVGETALGKIITQNPKAP